MSANVGPEGVVLGDPRAQMRLYDTLPAPIRKVVAEAPLSFRPSDVRDLARRYAHQMPEPQVAEQLRRDFANTAALAHKRDYGG